MKNGLMPGNNPVTRPLRPFHVEKSDVTIHANFQAPFWPLVHNMPSLYSALLDGMREFGVGSQAIRNDSGDGSLGGYNVNFGMLEFRAIGRIRLETAEFQCPNLAKQDLDQIERAFVRFADALVTAQSDVRFASWDVSVNLHGQPEEIAAKDYLSGFLSKMPDGMGPCTGSGVVFYFGERPPTISSSVTAEISAILPDRVFVRVHSMFDGAAVPPNQLRRVVQDNLDVGLRSIGLSRD